MSPAAKYRFASSPAFVNRRVPVKRARACICTMSASESEMAPEKPCRRATAPSIALTSVSSEHGFSRYSTEPRRLTSSRASGDPKAVITTAGSPGAAARARTSRSSPLMVGIRRSVTRASGALSWIRRSAASGSVKPSTR
jgi:hypothetical protein